MVRGNTLHHTDGHGPRGVQGEIVQAWTGRGLSMWLPSRPETPQHILYESITYNSIRDQLRERALIEGVAAPPPSEFLGAERVLQRIRGVRGLDEKGRRYTSWAIVVIVRNRTSK